MGMRKYLIILFITLCSFVKSQTCTTLVAYDYIETYDWVGLWFGNSLNSSYFIDASVSPTTSAVMYGSGGGSSAIEQDWYVLPNITGLDPSFTYQFKFRLGSYTFTNSTAGTRGVDTPDLVEVQVSTNGEISYTSEIRITGNGNATWNYNTLGVISKTASGALTTYTPAGGGNRTTTGDGYSDITLTLTGISQIAIDILCRVNAAGEEWWLDNMELYEIAPCSPLPVQLVNFNGTNDGKYNNLNWKTFSETNNSHFEVERSLDAINWSSIGIVFGNGTTLQEQLYQYNDYEFITNSINYYRLKQIDYDGNFEYSNIVGIRNDINRKIVKLISLEGKEVDENYKGFVIECYDDGTYMKRVQY